MDSITSLCSKTHEIYSREFLKFLEVEAEKIYAAHNTAIPNVSQIHAYNRGMKIIICAELRNYSIRDRSHPPLLRVDGKEVIHHPNTDVFYMRINIGPYSNESSTFHEFIFQFS